jgi:hypothetical protein
MQAAELARKLRPGISRRGPDVFGEHLCRPAGPAVAGVPAVRLLGAVLHLRGRDGSPTAQPLVDNATGDALCWNGQVADRREAGWGGESSGLR